MEAEKAQFALREKEYEEKLNRMGIGLNSRIDVEERLMGEIKALRASEEEARARAEEERGKVREAIQKVQEANERARQATKRAEEAEAKVDRAVDAWKESSKFDVVAQDIYVVALEELVGHIRKERPNIDVAFLDEALEGQKEELRRLSKSAGVRVLPTAQDVEDNTPAHQDTMRLKTLFLSRALKISTKGCSTYDLRSAC
ncbi:uncharacterized protein LOC111383491, partial [Olea europaea var. sylvestris]|uniref:uncharacterized protein LOC111383491 n=1 Tax=Olea europaea var. sylvestris TaxID=158386 RepID=UPI000C1D5C05